MAKKCKPGFKKVKDRCVNGDINLSSPQKSQIKKIFFTFILMMLGLILFKFIPMKIWGNEILFDASAHLVLASFILYIFYFFIDQNKNWRFPYFIFSFAVLTIVSLQRIITDHHNDIGLLIGVFIVIVSISIPHWKKLKRKIEF